MRGVTPHGQAGPGRAQGRRTRRRELPGQGGARGVRPGTGDGRADDRRRERSRVPRVGQAAGLSSRSPRHADPHGARARPAGSFRNLVIWRRPELLWRVLVFSRPSVPQRRRGFLNATENRDPDDVAFWPTYLRQNQVTTAEVRAVASLLRGPAMFRWQTPRPRSNSVSGCCSNPTPKITQAAGKRASSVLSRALVQDPHVVLARAFGDDVDELPPKLENPRRACERLRRS